MDKARTIELVNEAKKGNRNAFNELFDYYYKDLYYSAYKMVKNEEAAADATQDTFEEILKSIGQLSEPSAFGVWAKHILMRKCRKVLVNNMEILAEPDEEGKTVFDDMLEENRDMLPESALESTQVKNTVRTVLDSFGKEQRLATTLYYLDGKKIEEIATALNTSCEKIEEYLKASKEAFENQIEERERRIYDVFISYTPKDKELAERIALMLREQNISVYDTTEIKEDVAKKISEAKIFIPIVTKHSVESGYFFNELYYAVDTAKNRSKMILPLINTAENFTVPDNFAFVLGRYQMFCVDSGDENSVITAIMHISGIVRERDKDNFLFSKLSEYINAGLNSKATEVICLIIEKLCKKIDDKLKSEDLLTLISYLDKMLQLYEGEYGEAEEILAHKKLVALKNVNELIYLEEFKYDDLYMTAIAIRLICLIWEIKQDCCEVIFKDEKSEAKEELLNEEEYVYLHQHFIDKYDCLLQNTENYTEAEMQFIVSAKSYFYSQRQSKTAAKKEETQKLSKNEELLQSVAAFTKEGNRIFDIIGEEKPARDFLKCLITSYERLKNYCDVVGAKEICGECIDRIAELKYKLSKTEEKYDEADQNDNTDMSQMGIKTLLGLTNLKTGEYDVFISHKGEDYDIALQMFEFLRANLKLPFFDKNSLPEASEAKYRKAIMQALDKSKHFVVVFSDLEYLESYWVSTEMEIFMSEIDEGRKPDANFIMVVTNDVYDEIIRTNKAVLPIEYRRCEILKIDDYKNTLLNYLSKK
ncbi:MAG: sigma-70 family RNA polymerase sigma factor [Acutalibacteraceae bacterium]|nr:sigma-70 family RNA polymerase sigma factor [Acutalibacteraceae bacterium]